MNNPHQSVSDTVVAKNKIIRLATEWDDIQYEERIERINNIVDLLQDNE